MLRLFKPTWGPSIKYVTQFFANFDPLPLSHFVKHPGTPPIFSRPSTKNPDKSPYMQILSQLFSGAFVRGLLSGGLLSGRGRICPGSYLSAPPSVRIHLLQQKVKNHFKFHVSYV